MLSESDRANGQFTQTGEQPLNRWVQSTEWAPCELTTRVEGDADAFAVGVLAVGVGMVWADAFDVAVKDASGAWLPVPLVNSGFEEADRNRSPIGWSAGGGRHGIATAAYQGKHSLAIETVPVVDRDLWPLGWSLDGKRVFALDRQTFAVVSMPSTGGDVTTLFDAEPGQGFDVTMTSDGRRFVLAKEEGTSDIWIVDNFDQRAR